MLKFFHDCICNLIFFVFGERRQGLLNTRLMFCACFFIDKCSKFFFYFAVINNLGQPVSDEKLFGVFNNFVTCPFSSLTPGND